MIKQKENIYIQSATLNGKPFNSLKLLHSDIVKGGTLELEMGSLPNMNFGKFKTFSKALNEFLDVLFCTQSAIYSST